jgi:alpha-L-rhamnosidase
MMRTEQLKHEGGVPAYVPAGHAFCPIAALWGDAATFIPATLWKYFHSEAELRYAYPMMKDWVDYVSRQIEATSGSTWGLWQNGFQFGDWLALDGKSEQDFKGATPDVYVASMYYCRSLEILAEAAGILGFKDDADKYGSIRQKQYEFLMDEYFTPHGHLCVNTQAAYIIAMEFDICRDKTVLAEDFKAKLKLDGFRIRAGFAGAPNLCQALSKYGCTDLAYTFLLNEGFPGWLYAVNLGATTVWERWNSLIPDGTVSGTGMNSLNHYSYGSVAEFLYADVLGIRPSSEGFHKAVIAPKPDSRIRHACGSYKSAWGEYSAD